MIKKRLFQDGDEEKLKHRIPHRFETFTNLSANWCCHCGYMLPLGRKNAKKCSECHITCHSTCTHFVPDFCGMNMETANKLLADMKLIKSTQNKKPTIKQVCQVVNALERPVDLTAIVGYSWFRRSTQWKL